MYKYCKCKTCKMFRRDLEFNNIYGARPQGICGDKAWPYNGTKEEYINKGMEYYYKGKDNDMTNITVQIMGGKKIDYARAIKAEFGIDAPKFDVGAKIKFYNTYSPYGDPNWKQGVIYSLNKKVTVSKTDGEKEFKADNLQWFYTIIENGNLKTWNGIKEDAIKIDDTPDYNKYFDFLDKQGVKLDRTRYTWKKFVQTDCIKYVNYYFGSVNPHAWETEYLAVLCDKTTKKTVEFKGTQVGTDKLPAISEKC